MVIEKKLQVRPQLSPLALQLPLPPVVQRVLANRGITDASELEKSAARLLPFQLLKGIDQAVDLLLNVKARGEKIIIVGDFDADGATSTATLLSGLRLLGFSQLD